MKKEQFLQEIQSGARVNGSKAQVAWDAAIKIDEKDARWSAVEEYYPVETFAKAFGVELPVYAKIIKSKLSPVERFEKKLAVAKKSGNAEEIAYFEMKLAQAKKDK